MANVLLGVTGSVAAILTSDLYGRLRQVGHAVRVVATEASRGRSAATFDACCPPV